MALVQLVQLRGVSGTYTKSTHRWIDLMLGIQLQHWVPSKVGHVRLARNSGHKKEPRINILMTAARILGVCFNHRPWNPPVDMLGAEHRNARYPGV